MKKWSAQEDLLLANVCLQSIRDGELSKQALLRASQQLERTVYSCQFRWQHIVKQRYAQEIVESKKIRNAKKIQIQRSVSYSMADIIEKLEEIKERYIECKKELAHLMQEVEEDQNNQRVPKNDKTNWLNEWIAQKKQ